MKKILFTGIISAVVAGASFVVWAQNNASSASTTNSMEITVYKSPYCGCCGKWVEHLQENNFKVSVIETEAMDEMKKKFGVPETLQSCHTATINGYVVEGHVPAASIQKLLQEAPQGATGIAVGGMPVGSPGMEVEGMAAESYNVMQFNKNGTADVFERY